MKSALPSTAYILQIHKNPAQVNTFISQLTATDTADVYVHIDKKNYDEVSPKINRSPRINVLEESCNVKWGDISQVDATIMLLRKVLTSKVDYDFVCLRSGQDLLVKNGLKVHLMENPNKIFMSAKFIHDRDISAAHVNMKWFDSARRQYNTFHPLRIFRSIMLKLYKKGLVLFPNRQLMPNNYLLYHGSSWFCIPIEVARFIIDFIDQNKWYYQYFKNALCPDEWFFQTLVMNSKYADQVANDNLTYLKWGEEYNNSNHPINLSFKDIDSIEKSNKYFARKFDEREDVAMINYYSEKVCM
ncbi:beta-1,6-N-acetylglucosaminyltransferase [Paenibacillus sp. NRS-1760]|uniref:beta-1,6-N-acetylglucosaminyltransferase n=1 Tax=Paenibacillus sp. NRS-1760 TaxID=3233902 RepID=UPI003D2E2739